MDQQRIDMFIMTNQKYFPEEKMVIIRERLNSITEEKFSLISTAEFKDPTTILLVSIFLGTLGIGSLYDRRYRNGYFKASHSRMLRNFNHNRLVYNSEKSKGIKLQQVYVSCLIEKNHYQKTFFDSCGRHIVFSDVPVS